MLTDRKIKALKAGKGDLADTDIAWDEHGLGVRVSDKGTKTFVLVARFPRNPASSARVALGRYDTEMSLEEARDKATAWRKLIAKGIDPRDQEEREQAAEARKHKDTFAAVAVKFIEHCRRIKLRTVDDMERNLNQTFVAAWSKRPIAEITADNVKAIIRQAVEREATYQAFADFALIRRLFNWAIGTTDYGLVANPCDQLSTGDLIGEKASRERTLSDAEIKALWVASEKMGYPYGQLYRVLLLTGLRLGEACGARWSEFDFDRKEWTVPASRMKKTKNGAKAHIVPITDALQEVLDSVPRFHSGDYLFSNSYGKSSLQSNFFSKPKERLDKLMAEELGELEDWRNHDTRRTVKTNMERLRIPEPVSEAVLAHTKKGISAVYGRYGFEDEKRFALDAWAQRLRSIVDPQPANVVSLRA
jgi:integrase